MARAVRASAGMARLPTTLGVALFLGAIAGRARAESPWDNVRSVLGPNARFSATLHATQLPDTLRLCHPVGKSCPSAGSIGSFPGGTAVTTGYGVAVDVISLGPFRLGLDVDFAWGKGPSLRLSPAQALSGSWVHTDVALALGVRLRHGAWRGYGEILPGFMSTQSSVSGHAADGRSLDAVASTLSVGARTGVGIALRQWLDAGVYVGATAGSFYDISGGLRLDFSDPQR